MKIQTIAATLLLVVLAGSARADLTLTLTAPNVDLNNLVVGQTFEIDLIATSTTQGEFTQAFEATQIGGESNGVYNVGTSLHVGPGVHEDLSTSPTVGIADATALAAGSGSFYFDFSHDLTASGGFNGFYTTNLATYHVDTNSLSFTVRSVPEPSSLVLLGLGAVFVERKFRRRR